MNSEHCDPFKLRELCDFSVVADFTRFVNRRHAYQILMSSIEYEEPDAIAVTTPEFDKMCGFLMLPDSQVVSSSDTKASLGVYAFTVLINNLRRRLRQVGVRSSVRTPSVPPSTPVSSQHPSVPPSEH